MHGCGAGCHPFFHFFAGRGRLPLLRAPGRTRVPPAAGLNLLPPLVLAVALGALPAPAPPRPVIVIPGTMGSVLVREGSERRVWGTLTQLRFLSPHRGIVDPRYDGLELPTASTVPSENRDSIVAHGVLKRFSIFPRFLSVKAYQGLIRLLERHGYVLGDIEHPTANATCYLFAYDWRRDIAESAAGLARAVERVRSVAPGPERRVDLVAHSMGGLVARYFLRFGARDVLGTDPVPPPSWEGAAAVRHAILIGTPNRGSVEGFRAMLHGQRLLWRKVSPLTLFTFPSCYELLPAPDETVFLDADGLPVEADLYDADDWRRYGWSVYGPRTRARFHRACLAELGPDGERAFREKYREWDRFLAAMLERARRFHAALSRGIPPEPVEIELLGARCQATLARAILYRKSDRFVTATRSGERPRGMSRRRFRELTSLPGDGRVTAASLAMRPDPDAPDPPRVVWGCRSHDRLIDDETIAGAIIRILREP